MARSDAIAAVAALVGEPARAAMLDALLGGRALPAGALARAAGVSPATASGHLARLLDGGLVTAEWQGRERRFQLAGPGVAEVLEALGELAGPAAPARTLRAASRMDALRAARTCYDHLAGRLGVAVTDALVAEGWLADSDGGFAVTRSGEDRFGRLGIDVAELRRLRRPLTRRCVDWTERRPHLAGSLGAALAARALELGWVARVPHDRALEVTEAGERALRRRLGVDVSAQRTTSRQAV